MKKIVFALSILLASSLMIAQNKAKNLLDDVAEKAMSYKNISIKFKHSLDNSKANVHQETNGSVILQGDLYHFKYMGTEQIFDGTKTYIILHEDEEVVVQPTNDDNNNTLTPSKLFSFYKNGYTYTIGKHKKVKGINVQYVILTPMDKTSEIEKILVGILPNKKQLHSIIEMGKNGTNTTIKITSFTTNQPISNKLFIFNREKFEKRDYTISEAK